MIQISHQPYLRPALPEITGCKDYRDERELFIRIDEILTRTRLEEEFIELYESDRLITKENGNTLFTWVIFGGS